MTTNKSISNQSSSPIPALLLLLITTFFVYVPSLNHGFITSWDDNHFVTENAAITSLSFQNIKAIFSNTLLNMYSPLTILSLAVDYSFWELKPFGYHLTNLVFHLLNTVFVFFIFKRITTNQWLVLFVSTLFALHPMHVESVAWISERKDVLYAFFYLLAIITYLQYVEYKNYPYFIFTILLFILSCLAKPMAITLPIILGLIQWYRNTEKFHINTYFPLFILVFISIVFTILPFMFHDSKTLTDDLSTRFNIIDRFFLLTYAIGFYLVKLILPIQQSAFHYYPEKVNGHLPSIYYMSGLLLPIIAFTFWKINAARKTYIFVGLFFLVSIALVLKIVPFGNAVVAERYTYLPYLGLFFGLGLIIQNLFQSDSLKAIILLVIGLALALTSFNRLKVWKNNLSLFTDIIAKYPTTAIPYNIRADVFSKEENTSAALADYNQSILLDPANYETYVNRGVIYFKLNRFDEAIADYNIAIKINSKNAKLFNNRGTCFLKINQYAEALKDFEIANKLEPNNILSLSNLGLCYYHLKDYKTALSYFNQALSLSPDDWETLKNRGNTKAFLKDLEGSIADYTKIIANNPNDANALSNRGNSYYQLNKLDLACDDWKKAAQLGNSNAIGAVTHICK